MEHAVREAMAEGALLSLLAQFNGTHDQKADRVTVSLTTGADGGCFTDATYWAGDVPVGGEGF